MYGGVARGPPELEGVAQVLEWRQVQEYAAPRNIIRLRRMNLVLHGRAQEGGGQRHVPMSLGVNAAH